MSQYQILIGSGDRLFRDFVQSVFDKAPFHISISVKKNRDLLPALMKSSLDLAVIDTGLFSPIDPESACQALPSSLTIPLLLISSPHFQPFLPARAGISLLVQPVTPEILLQKAQELLLQRIGEEKNRLREEIEQTTRVFLDDADQGLLIWNQNRFHFINRKAHALFRGKSTAPETAGWDWLLEDCPREDRERMFSFLDLSLRTPDDDSTIVIRRDSKRSGSIWLEIRAKSILYSGELSLKLTVNDISERVELKTCLLAQEETFQALAETPSILLFCLDLDDRLTYISPPLRALLKIPEQKKETQFGSLLDRIQPNDIPSTLTQAKKGTTQGPIEIHLAIAKKERIVLETTLLPLTRNGLVHSLLGIARQKVESQRRESDLSDSELKWQTLVQYAPERINLVDREGTILYRNRSIVTELTEHEQEISLFDFVNAEGAKKISDNLDRVFDTGVSLRFEYYLLPLRGGRRCLESSLTPIFHNGTVTSAMCITQDITTRKRTEEALRLSERLNRATIDALSDPIYAVDKELSITLYNRAFAKWCEHLHLDTTAVGKNIFNIFPFFTKKNREEYKLVLKNGQPLVSEDKIILSGSTFYTETVKVPIIIDDKIEQVLTILHDLTPFRKAEAALTESMRRYELAVEASGQIAFEYAPENGRIIWGKSVEKILGYPLAEIDGTLRQWLDWLHPEDRRLAVQHLDNPSIEDPFRSSEFRIRHRSGSYIWIRSRGFFLQHQPGQAIRFLGMMEDISRQKEIEAELSRSEEMYRMLFHQNIVGNVIFIGQRVAMCNDAFCTLHRMTPEEMTDMPVMDLIHPDDRLQAVDRINRLLSGQIVQESHVYRAKRGKNEYFLAEVRSKSIQWRGQQAIQSVIRDITEQKRAEEALRESEERYRTLVERVIDGIYRSTPDGRFIDVNPAMVTMLGYNSREDLLQIDISQQLYFDISERDKLILEQSASDTKIIEVRLRRRNGTPIWVEDHGHYVRDKDGNVILHEGIIRDISERKRAEEHLREQFRFIETLLDTIPNPVYYQNTDQVYLGCNREFETFFGVRREDLIGRTMGEFGVPNLIDSKNPKSELQLQGRELFEGSVTTCRGEKREVLFTKAPFTDAGGKTIGQIGIIVDINERVKMEEKIRAERDRAQTYLDIANVGIVAINREGNVILINKQGCELLGYPEEEIIGRNWFDRFIPPGPREEVRFVFNRIIQGAIEPFAYHENTILTRSGEERLIAWDNTVVRDGEGKIIASLSSGQDITGRRQAEEKIQSSLKEKEILLREIHHRVKNNLQVISSLLKLQAGATHDPVIQKLFQDSRDRIRSISLVHEKLYRSADLTNIDFRDYVENLTKEMFRTYKVRTDEIKLDLRVEDLHIGVNTSIPCGLIINEILSNSLKHAFPVNVDIKEKKISLDISGPDPENQIHLRIGDNGVGLPQALDFTTTDSLGLRLVRILVTDQLNGKIELDRTNGILYQIVFPAEET